MPALRTRVSLLALRRVLLAPPPLEGGVHPPHNLH
jgi:hypothetical protein